MLKRMAIIMRWSQDLQLLNLARNLTNDLLTSFSSKANKSYLYYYQICHY